MANRFNLEVTEKDIERAVKNNSSSCVVAQAVARGVKGATRIDVDIQSVRFTLEGERLTFFTPYAVQGYIVAFDAGDPIQPFRFQLRDPVRVRRHIKTETGRAMDAARAEAAREAERIGATPEEKRKMAAKAATRAKKEAVRQGKPTAQTAKRSDGDGRKAPPRPARRKRQRMYGHRVLRDNRLPSSI